MLSPATAPKIESTWRGAVTRYYGGALTPEQHDQAQCQLIPGNYDRYAVVF